jgi:hypothetical protein
MQAKKALNLKFCIPFCVSVYSGGFLQRQKVIDSYHIKKFVKESQFLLFSRQKVH